MALTSYLTQVSALLTDSSNQYYSTTDLTSYINSARSQIAMEGQCVRILPSGNNTVAAQEVYTFATVNALLNSSTTGVQEVIMVNSIAISWGTIKPTLRHLAWDEFQAQLRAINTQLQSWPQYWAQYAQGVSGSVYFWPIPVQVMSMDWDCICRPVDLADDTTIEAVPWPWTDAIQYYAAYLALLYQKPQQAELMLKLYEKFMQRAQAMTNQTFVYDPYDS